MSQQGGGSTLDSIFNLGTEYVRARYTRVPSVSDPRDHAVPVPAATTAQVRQAPSSGGMRQYVPMILAAAAVVLIVGLVLKKAG